MDERAGHQIAEEARDRALDSLLTSDSVVARSSLDWTDTEVRTVIQNRACRLCK
jgi:hypothetical protein